MYRNGERQIAKEDNTSGLPMHPDMVRKDFVFKSPDERTLTVSLLGAQSVLDMVAGRQPRDAYAALMFESDVTRAMNGHPSRFEKKKDTD